jgi:hypothetical protein
MTAVIDTEGLGKRYRTRWALALALALAGYCFWRLNRRRS